MAGSRQISLCELSRSCLLHLLIAVREEHFKRSPECPFFTLVNNHKQSPVVKRTKSKRERTSKASRLSTQSAFTVASEAPSVTDGPAGDEDSILTTATNATTKKMGKAKKPATGKGRKTRAKKAEPVEVAAPEPEDADFEVKVDPEPKPTRGKKRKSEDHDVIVPVIEMGPPPPKRRATRTRGSMAVDESTIESSDNMQPETSKPGGRKGRTSIRSTRKASVASVASLRAPVTDDAKIDKALEADLERRLSDDELETTSSTATKKLSRSSKIVKADHAMFGVDSSGVDEAAIEAELNAMDIESKPLPKAKGAKAKQPRKPSAKQQAAAKKAAEAEAEAQARQLAEEDEASLQIAMELEHSISMQQSSPVIQQKKQRASAKQPTRPMPSRATRGSVLSVNDHTSAIGDYQESNDDQKDDSGHETDASVASQSTIVRGGPSRRGSTLKKGRGGKKAASRNIEEVVHKSQAPIPSIEVPDRDSSVKGKRVIHFEEVSMTEEVFYTPVPEAPKPAAVEPPAKSIKAKATKTRGRPPKATPEASSQPIATVEEPIVLEEAAPAQNKAVSQKTKQIPEVRSPTPAPIEATPSQSPQSSDAENYPPSSKPSAATKKTATPHSTAKRIPLAPTTPSISPSKRNVIAGLQSLHPWTAVDLEAIFLKSPGGENSIGNVADFLGSTVDNIKNGDLTSPEKRMTVEEWIHHNARMAEEKLKNECERMVGKFESEGTRAMRALEGVECVE